MSKLSIHYQYVPEWAKLLPQTWAKIIDPPSENPFPGARVIGRTYVQDGESDALVMLAEAGAELWFARFRDTYARCRYITAWEGPNEPPVDTPERRAALVRFSRRWIDLMHAAGYKTVVLNLSNSWPATGTTHSFVEVVRRSDYWALHEYAAPTMQNQAGELCLHYRRVVDELRAAGLAMVSPLLITECGIDDGQRHGWHTFGAADNYVAQLGWYANELQQDTYVDAAFVFTAGPLSGWDNFDVTEDLAKRILALTTSAPIDEVLPDSEPYPMPIGQLADKVRWWMEQSLRMHEAGRGAYALAIHRNLIELNSGLLYRLERTLKLGKTSG